MGPLFRIHDNAKLILRWLLIIVPISVAVGSVVALFLWLLDLGTVTRIEHPWLLFMLPAAGLVIVLSYRAAGVIVGNLTPNISFAGILGQMWSFDGKFSSAIIQPMLFYNFDSIPGAYVAYNAVTSVNWLAEGSNKWTVPLGLSIGRTFDMGGGNAFDAMIGPYYNVARPDGAANWMIRFGISWMFP